MAAFIDIFFNEIATQRTLSEIYTFCQETFNNNFWLRLAQIKIPDLWQFLQNFNLSQDRLVFLIKIFSEILYLFEEYFQQNDIYTFTWLIKFPISNHQYFPQLTSQLQITPDDDFEITGRLIKTSRGNYLLLYQLTYLHPELGGIEGPNLELLIPSHQWSSFLAALITSAITFSMPPPGNPILRRLWDRFVQFSP